MRVRRLTLAVVIAVMAMVVGSCAGETAATDSTASTFAPLTVPPSTATAGSDATVTTTDADPASTLRLTPAAVLGTITVGQAGECSQERGAILITHDPGAASILRQMTALIDGIQTSTNFDGTPDRFEIPGVSCDGAVHTVLVVTVDLEGSTRSRAFAVRMTP